MGFFGFPTGQRTIERSTKPFDITHYVSNQAKYASQDIDKGAYGLISSTQKVIITITKDGKNIQVLNR